MDQSEESGTGILKMTAARPAYILTCVYRRTDNVKNETKGAKHGQLTTYVLHVLHSLYMCSCWFNLHGGYSLTACHRHGLLPPDHLPPPSTMHLSICVYMAPCPPPKPHTTQRTRHALHPREQHHLAPVRRRQNACGRRVFEHVHLVVVVPGPGGVACPG